MKRFPIRALFLTAIIGSFALQQGAAEPSGLVGNPALTLAHDGAFALIDVDVDEYARFTAELEKARAADVDAYLSKTLGPLLAEVESVSQLAKAYGIARPTDEFVQGMSAMCSVMNAAAEIATPDKNKAYVEDANLFVREALHRADDKAKMIELAKEERTAGDSEWAEQLQTTADALMSREQVYATHILTLERVMANTSGGNTDVLMQSHEMCTAEAKRLRGRVVATPVP